MVAEQVPRVRYGVVVRRGARRRLRELADAALTYPQVGATRDDRLPGGYGHVFRDVLVGTGPAVFRRTADRLLGWDVHRGAGLKVTATHDRAVPEAIVLLQAGPVVAGLQFPCRVVYTVTEPDRQGFAYGTLPGHPEQGEEAFLVTIIDGADVHFHIRAFSRAATLPARLGGPLTRLVQRNATDRYVKAAARIAHHDATGR
jgi:uncharacterized protein (UPF0548 family)